MSRNIAAAVGIGLVAAAVTLPPAAFQAAAQQPAAAPASVGFAEYMLFTQQRHAKLWLAGEARNWALADYQIDELKEGLEDAAKHFPTYKDVPVGRMIEQMMATPISDVEAAVKAQDRAKFMTAFDQLTTACNACHQASNRPYLVMQRPTTSPFPNQSFAPKR